MSTVSRDSCRRGVRGVVALVLVVAAACATDGDEGERSWSSAPVPRVERIGGIPVLVDHVHGPGTPLRGGLAVPEGALLLGEVLPVAPLDDPGAASGTQWLAALVVTGDPEAVHADLAGQLRALGADPAGDCHGLVAHGAAPPASAVSCGLRAEHPAPDGGVEHLWAGLHRGPAIGPDRTGQGGQEPASHLVLWWGDAAPAAGGGYGSPAGAPPEVPVPAIPALPAVGDRLVPRPVSPYPDEVGLRVAEGTALVGPEIPWWAGSPRLVLHAAGDPAAAVAAYVDQVVALHPGAAPATMTSTEVEGRTVARQLVPIDADGTFSATAVARPGHPTYLVLDRLHD